MLGLIHTIDTAARCFYIQTPVPFDQLKRVNTLIKGNIETPLFLFFLVSPLLSSLSPLFSLTLTLFSDWNVLNATVEHDCEYTLPHS